MIHYKTEVIPERTVTSIDKTTCDLCGEEIKEHFGYDFCDIEVSMEKGTRYPGSCYAEKTTIDICESCFTNKVMPAIEALGGKFREVDTGY